MKKTIGVTICVLAVAALALAIIPTTRDEIHWRWASYKDEMTGYESYVRTWPDGRHAAEAQARYDEHGWADAKAANTVQGFERYVQLYGEGKHLAEAKDNIESLYWQEVKAKRTVEACEDFLRRYPNGLLADSARASIEELRFQKAAESGSVEAYEEFLQLHPSGVLAQKAQTAIEELLPPGPTITAVEVVGAERSGCRVNLAAAVRHKSGKVTAKRPPLVDADPIECGGMYFAGEADVTGVVERDPNHSTVKVSLYSYNPGWGGSYISGCKGVCELGFALFGQKRRVKVTFK